MSSTIRHWWFVIVILSFFFVVRQCVFFSFLILFIYFLLHKNTPKYYICTQRMRLIMDCRVSPLPSSDFNLPRTVTFFLSVFPWIEVFTWSTLCPSLNPIIDQLWPFYYSCFNVCKTVSSMIIKKTYFSVCFSSCFLSLSLFHSRCTFET